MESSLKMKFKACGDFKKIEKNDRIMLVEENLVLDKRSHENATHKQVGEVVPYYTLKEETRLESSFSLFPFVDLSP